MENIVVLQLYTESERVLPNTLVDKVIGGKGFLAVSEEKSLRVKEVVLSEFKNPTTIDTIEFACSYLVSQEFKLTFGLHRYSQNFRS